VVLQEKLCFCSFLLSIDKCPCQKHVGRVNTWKGVSFCTLPLGAARLKLTRQFGGVPLDGRGVADSRSS